MLGIFSGRTGQNRRLICQGRKTWRRSSDFTKKAGPVDLVRGVLQVEASFFVIAVLKPSSDGAIFPTATSREPPSFFFSAVRVPLAIEETTGPGVLPSSMTRTTAWRARTSSSLHPGRRLRLMCCGQRPDGLAAESSAQERSASWTSESEENVAREPGAIGRSLLCSRWRITVSHLLGDSRCGALEVHRARRNRPWEVGLPSPGSWRGRLFVESRSHRRGGLWRGGRIQVPVSVFGQFVVLRGILGRPRSIVRTFVACRWRIACSSVCHPVHVEGPTNSDSTKAAPRIHSAHAIYGGVAHKKTNADATRWTMNERLNQQGC